MKHRVVTERTRLLVQLERMLEYPMLLLSLVWIILLVLELTRGLSPEGRILSTVIWGIFGADFVLKLLIAPRKLLFLRRNWLTILSLVLPALRLLRLARVLRFVRVARVARGVRLAKFLGGVNRGMRALRRSMRRHGFGYVVATTILVLLAGAGAMMSFEREGPRSADFDTYPDALWWTAMLLTTLGSEAWPATAAGRTLTVLLALYAFMVFGYITATLASFFVERDAGRQRRAESS